jgi:hypothetical protein
MTCWAVFFFTSSRHDLIARMVAEGGILAHVTVMEN